MATQQPSVNNWQQYIDAPQESVISSNGKFLIDTRTNRVVGKRVTVQAKHNWQDVGPIMGAEYECKDCGAQLTDETGFYTYIPGEEGVCCS